MKLKIVLQSIVLSLLLSIGTCEFIVWCFKHSFAISVPIEQLFLILFVCWYLFLGIIYNILLMKKVVHYMREHKDWNSLKKWIVISILSIIIGGGWGNSISNYVSLWLVMGTSREILLTFGRATFYFIEIFMVLQIWNILMGFTFLFDKSLRNTTELINRNITYPAIGLGLLGLIWVIHFYYKLPEAINRMFPPVGGVFSEKFAVHWPFIILVAISFAVTGFLAGILYEKSLHGE